MAASYRNQCKIAVIAFINTNWKTRSDHGIFRYSTYTCIILNQNQPMLINVLPIEIVITANIATLI